MNATTETLVTSKGRTVNVTMSDEDAATECLNKTGNEFAQKLGRAVARGWNLSTDQRAWLHIIAQQATAPVRQSVAIGDAAGMVNLFRTAKASGLKFPKLHLQTASGQSVRLSLAGERARHPGSINVTSDAGFHDSDFFGRVHPDGRFETSKLCPPDLPEYMVEFAKDPETYAREHGRKTGHCCFCGALLTNSESVALGMGPICRAKWIR